jgi:hypothetical protein
MFRGLGAQKKKSNFFLEKYKFWHFLRIIVNIGVDIDCKRVFIAYLSC